MKVLLAGIAALAAAGMAALSSAAQSPGPPTPAQQPATQAAPENPQPGGKVIFSRSTDENGETTSQAGPAAAAPAIKMASEPSAEDAEREAVTFTDFDMDVHLRTAEQHIGVRAQITVRNDGKSPLAHIPLQISSSLNWERIRVNGADVPFTVATLNSDADHTGQLHEAAVTPADPLAAGATLRMDVTYAGTIAATAQRLVVLGTPDDLALHSDWDRIGVPFTGLRGFGNVVWYPVSSVPVILGDGARIFDEIGEQKQRLSGARFRLRLAVEFPRGQAPTVALIDGHPAALAVTEPAGPNEEVSSVARADSGATTLGFETPSLFVAIRTPHAGANTTVWTLPEDEAAVEGWTQAASTVTPFLEGWLGQRPRSQLNVLDLPDPGDAPFETGGLLAAPIREGSQWAGPDQLDGILVHALAQAWMTPSPADSAKGAQAAPAWLTEGVATFMGTVWTERRRGREQALGMLESGRTALALAEPASPGDSGGQPLAQAISPVYYRTKAAYVLWMLRDLAGDPALSAALRGYDAAGGVPAADTDKGIGKDDGRSPGSQSSSSFEKLLESGGNNPNLAAFFADWVDADKGLPDLSISGVFPTSETAGNWLVAVSVANSGYASAEVPVTVRSAATSVTERLLVPARGKAVQRILIQGQPTEAQVNDGTVPETRACDHAGADGRGSGFLQPVESAAAVDVFRLFPNISCRS